MKFPPDWKAIEFHGSSHHQPAISMAEKKHSDSRLAICHVQLTAVGPSHFKQSQFCGKCCAAQVIVVSIWQKPRQEPLDPTKNLGSNNDPWL